MPDIYRIHNAILVPYLCGALFPNPALDDLTTLALNLFSWDLE